MTDMLQLAQSISDACDKAFQFVEVTQEDDIQRGEIITPDRFSRGYALGYAHAMSAVYSMLPDWAIDHAAKLPRHPTSA